MTAINGVKTDTQNVPQGLTLTLDGESVTFKPGDTLLQVARSAGREIPTLCYDERLQSFGACRLCMVEVRGQRNPVASCVAPAVAGSEVHTAGEELDRHRKTLLEMVVSENPKLSVSPLRGYASQELTLLVEKYAAATGRFAGQTSGESHPLDDNPFLLRDYDLCISCYRCVRICAEQEGDYAISVANRGFHTQITTEFDNLLKDSACTFCGQCIHTCPTGALADKKALRFSTEIGEKPS